MVWQRVCVIGVGLLGGSLGLALKKRRLCQRVIGVGRDRDRLEKAFQCGAIDEYQLQIDQGARDADLVIACSPVQTIARHLIQAARVASPECLLTDVGSTKRSIVEAVENDGLESQFVGSHPMAGSDKSGVEFANADLFEKHLVLLTPTAKTPESTMARAERLWSELGARTKRLTPQDHDDAVARISHLPHLLAAALAGSTPVESLDLTATGWASTTRVAAGSPELWLQIVQENRLPVLRALENFATIWQTWIDAVKTDDPEKLQRLLQAGKQIRDVVGSRHSSG